jgi:long-chain acyl-CoA synthetase
MERTRDEILAALPRRLIDTVRRWAEATPDAQAVHHGARVWSFAELAAGIEAARARLAAAGVRPGDRVVLVIENGFAGLCLIHAVCALDAWAVLANARLSAREIGVIAEDSGARLTVFGTGESQAAAAHAAAAGAHPLVDEAFGAAALGPVNEAAVPEPVFEDPERQIAVMIFTSGSTGRPKGAMLSHRAVLYQCAIVSERRGFGPGDCPYVIAPMVHVLGLSGMVLPAHHAGAAVRLAARFDVEEVVAALKTGALTHLYGAPPMFAALVGWAARNGGRIEAPRLKEILAGGAPVDEELRAAAGRVFGMKLGAGYAATEFTPISASIPSRPANPGAAGHPWHGIELRIVDEAGNPLPQGEIGEVWCRGPNAMSGYYRDEEATAAAIRPGGWVATGDLARLDGDGQIHLVGRLKDIILRSGFTVYPAEIETVLNAHADVLQAAVVGRAVPGNEEAVAFVQPLPGAAPDPAELMAFAAARLAPYKRPARIVVLEALPVGPTGKLAKAELRERARDDVTEA